MAPAYDDTQAWQDAEEMGMTVYYVYLLKKGAAWSAESTPEIEALQAQHLANLRRLGEEGKLVLNGPLAEAQEWISTDPMVKIGRLVFELHAWMVGKGILP